MFCPSRRRRRVLAATTPVFHHLEKRLLLHGAVNVAIDFQPVGSAPAEGFFADVGRPYGERTHGMSYGWRRDSGAWTNSWAYERDHPASLSQAGDTLISAGWAGDLRWEIALPAGRYRVTLLAGDALAAAGERFVAEIEGRQALDFTASPTEKLVTDRKSTRLNSSHSQISYAVFCL